jgi:hypothetical protein
VRKSTINFPKLDDDIDEADSLAAFEERSRRLVDDERRIVIRRSAMVLVSLPRISMHVAMRAKPEAKEPTASPERPKVLRDAKYS